MELLRMAPITRLWKSIRRGQTFQKQGDWTGGFFGLWWFELSGSQWYKTFYGRNLRNFVIIYDVCPGKPVQPNMMFVEKAGAILEWITWKGRLQPYLQFANIRLGCKGLLERKNSSFLRTFVNEVCKKYIIGPWKPIV